MKRSPFIVLGIVAFAVLLFAAAFFCANRFYASRAAQPASDLAWLKQEFRLSEAEMARIEKLHAGYLPKCAEMCAKIAAKKREIESTLTDVTNVTDTARQKLGELASLRAQCQAQMLEHFVEVSHAMPPEQGQRYLAEMKRITLGTHEKVEESMSGAAGQSHGHE